MNFNEMIEREINQQVENRVAAYKTELQAEFDKKLAEAKEAYKNLLKAKIKRIFDEEDIFEQKCNFTSCKNYGDGTVDSICEKCDSHIIKKEKDNKCEENLSSSAAAKSDIKKEIKNSVKNIIANSEEKEEKEEKTKFDSVFEETLETLSPFFDLFGITKDDIKAAKEKMNDPKVKAEAESLTKALGLNI